jgi:uncharacterized membrane protein YeaQ/YmgE (transglycosylase-associated protein family)
MGAWQRVFRGVFSVGTAPVGSEQRELAALFLAGPMAALSHRTAAARWGLAVPPSPEVHLTLPAECRMVSVPGLKVSRSRDLGPDQLAVRGLVRLTNVARTLLDLSAELEPKWLRACLDSALRRGASLKWLRGFFDRRGRGHRGMSRLNVLLSEYEAGGAEIPDSVLESFAMELGLFTRAPRSERRGERSGLHPPLIRRTMPTSRGANGGVMGLETILLWAVVGLVAGWLASAVVGGGYGIVGDIIVGIVGAFLGGLVFRALGVSSPFGGLAGTIFVAFIGAVLLLLVLRALSRGAHRRV